MIIPQVERFATKFAFNEAGFNIRLWEQAMQEMAAKSDEPQGNVWAFVCNTRAYNLVQRRLSAWIRDWKTTGCFVWSQGQKGYVDLGATYQSYEFGGNKLIFTLDRSLDLEFPKKAYGLFLDLTTDSNGTPGVMFVTFKGGQLIHNVITGVEKSTCAA